ncbi:Gfo/Idh/MocA family protein [Kibdelosporangium persicum]|uniref:Glucose-fructose oxidoreductase n=1 Tax=Kibdelosporangium persicum TaxID=2698649 RepID=A0ABX2F5B1_9PSEU|nr:Gfo/Idh/MocA family oxidoreductase [Kibdelosporangium persicum]NRN66378.1 Glucose-fructose oxidoreductase [Kibdelosporangium persicum]
MFAEPQTTTMPLKCGVLGCSDIASRRTLPAMAASPLVDITAIASRDEGKAADLAARFGSEPVTGYERLLARPDVEAVYISLPPVCHAEWIERALRAGKHVLAEKPMTATAELTESRVALAESLGLALLENFMFLCHSQHRTVRGLVADGAIGELRTVIAEYAFPGKSPDNWRYQPGLGGGSLLDVGGYPIRTALTYLGDALDVAGATLRYDPKHGVDVSGSALLCTADGKTAHVLFGMDRSYKCGYQLWGSEGRIVVEWAYTPTAAHRPVVRVERQDAVQVLTLPADDHFVGVLTAFVNRVRHGVNTELEGKPVVRQAALVDRVRMAAVRRPLTGRPG